jgi:hypothetical protein
MNRSSKMLYNTQVMERTRRLAESKLIEVYKTFQITAFVTRGLSRQAVYVFVKKLLYT